MPAALDKLVEGIMRSKKAEFRKEKGRDPNEEELKKMRSSAFAIAQDQLKESKQSNAKVAINSKTSGKYEIRDIGGRQHIVTDMKPIEGDIVMNKGLYPDEELDISYTQLNNLPAPNGHPHIKGQSISAFHPWAMNAFNIGGFVQNSRKIGRVVKNDFCLDIEVANRTDDGKELIRRIEAGEEVGVSTGLMLTQIKTNGRTEDGQDYDWVGRNFRFDHVAILLNEEAAGAHVGTKLNLNSAGEGGAEDVFIVNYQKASEPTIEELQAEIAVLSNRLNSIENNEGGQPVTKKNDTSQGTGDKTDIGGKDKGAVNTPVENKEKPELTLAEATAFIESKGFVVNTKDQTEGIQELVENKNELLGLLAERKAAKASCVDVLVKNSNGTLTADDLAGFTLEKLEALAGQTTRVDNSLRGGGGVISTSSNDKNFMTNKDGSAYNYMGEENFAVDKEAN